MMLHRFALLAMLALATSCKEATAPPELTGAGIVTFTYDGTHITGGTFTATGPYPPDDPVAGGPVTWTAARRSVEHNTVSVQAQLVTDNEVHWLLIHAFVDPPGSSRINLDCGTGPLSSCTTVVWFEDQRFTRELLQHCGLGSGTVTITAISDTRVRGTFSGTGMCFRPVQGSFTVSSGEFDVPRSPDTPG